MKTNKAIAIYNEYKYELSYCMYKNDKTDFVKWAKNYFGIHGNTAIALYYIVKN